MRKIILSLFYILSLNSLSGQYYKIEKSVTLWSEKICINADSNDSLYFDMQIIPVKYLFDKYRCFGLLFDAEGIVYYQDQCPSDYEITSKIGTYEVDGDTVYISSINTSLPINFRQKPYDLRFGSIKSITIEDIAPEEPSKINFINEKWMYDKYDSRVLYYNRPNWIRLNVKSYSFGYKGIQKQLSKTIFIDHLLVSDMHYDDDRFDRGETFFSIQDNWKVKGKKMTIQFWEKAIKIVREKNEIVLYRWNWKKTKYEKASNLVLNYACAG